jgi:hypothetical protein
MELNHVFMCVEDAPAAERLLADFGLQFDLHATHAGQGPANACAFHGSVPIVTPPYAAHEPLIFVIPPTLPVRVRTPLVLRW